MRATKRLRIRGQQRTGALEVCYKIRSADTFDAASAEAGRALRAASPSRAQVHLGVHAGGSYPRPARSEADSIEELRWGTPGTRDPSIQSPDDITSLVTALQEQLGLKLQSTRGQYDVVVVDSVARPTAD